MSKNFVLNANLKIKPTGNLLHNTIMFVASKGIKRILVRDDVSSSTKNISGDYELDGENLYILNATLESSLAYHIIHNICEGKTIMEIVKPFKSDTIDTFVEKMSKIRFTPREPHYDDIINELMGHDLFYLLVGTDKMALQNAIYQYENSPEVVHSMIPNTMRLVTSFNKTKDTKLAGILFTLFSDDEYSNTDELENLLYIILENPNK